MRLLLPGLRPPPLPRTRFREPAPALHLRALPTCGRREVLGMNIPGRTHPQPQTGREDVHFLGSVSKRAPGVPSALAALLPHVPTSTPGLPGVTSQINHPPSTDPLWDLLLGEPNPRHLLESKGIRRFYKEVRQSQIPQLLMAWHWLCSLFLKKKERRVERWQRHPGHTWRLFFPWQNKDRKGGEMTLRVR